VSTFISKQSDEGYGVFCLTGGSRRVELRDGLTQESADRIAQELEACLMQDGTRPVPPEGEEFVLPPVAEGTSPPESLDEAFAVADDYKRLRELIYDNPAAFAAWHHGRTLGWDDNRSMRAVVAALCYSQDMLLAILAQRDRDLAKHED
jgi:hypothetical protein